MNIIEIFTSDIILAHIVSKTVTTKSFCLHQIKKLISNIHKSPLNVFSRFAFKKYFNTFLVIVFVMRVHNFFGSIVAHLKLKEEERFTWQKRAWQTWCLHWPFVKCMYILAIMEGFVDIWPLFVFELKEQKGKAA